MHHPHLALCRLTVQTPHADLPFNPIQKQINLSHFSHFYNLLGDLELHKFNMT